MISPPVSPLTPGYRNPGIVAYPTGIVCTWRELSEPVRDMLAVWDIEADTIGPPVVYQPPSLTSDGVPWNATITKFDRHLAGTPVSLPGDEGFEYNYRYTAEVTIPPQGNTDRPLRTAVASTCVALARAGVRSWITIDSMVNRNADYALPPEFDQTTAAVNIIGYDPADRDIVALFGVSRYYQQPFAVSLRGYRGDGTRWSTALPGGITFGSTIIPMGTTRYIHVENLEGRYFQGTTAIDSFRLPDGHGVKYSKLHGPYFAWTAWSNSDSSLFQVRILDTAGRAVHSVDVRHSTISNDYMLVAAPEDSIIAILFGSDYGLRATLLTNDLHIIAADRVISTTTNHVATPAGAFRGDTLFAVWQDYTGPVNRVYGTFYKTPSRRELGVENDRSWHSVPPDQSQIAVEQGEGSIHAATFVFPNPTRGEILVEADLKDRNGATFELATPSGEIVLRRPLFAGSIGAQCSTLSLDGLASGTYLACLRYSVGAMAQIIVKE